jgi:hypothetical protein
MKRPGQPYSGVRALVVLVLLLLVASCSSSAESPATGKAGSPTTASASAKSASPALAVASTLDGHATLPHRISWVAKPSVAESEVSEVDFLIDEKAAFVEQHAPYVYGRDGGYLVTTFLTPGAHSFTVRVITVGGQSATSTVKAAVATPTAPPGGLARTSWARTMTASDQKAATSSEPPPTGRWGLTIDSVGWMIHDPEGGGQLFDVAYQSRGRVELRPSIERPPFPNPTAGAFCEEPDPSFRWSYTIGDGGKTLSLQPVGHDPCGDRVAILEGQWTRKGS